MNFSHIVSHDLHSIPALKLNLFGPTSPDKVSSATRQTYQVDTHGGNWQLHITAQKPSHKSQSVLSQILHSQFHTAKQIKSLSKYLETLEMQSLQQWMVVVNQMDSWNWVWRSSASATVLSQYLSISISILLNNHHKIVQCTHHIWQSLGAQMSSVIHWQFSCTNLSQATVALPHAFLHLFCCNSATKSKLYMPCVSSSSLALLSVPLPVYYICIYIYLFIFIFILMCICVCICI